MDNKLISADAGNEQVKSKQKAGLNAVRPDDYVEGKFKEMAKNESISQTDLFERMFWNYISDIRSEGRENAIKLDDELKLISKDLDSIYKHFKTIVERSQDTVLTVKAHGDQKEKNLTLEVETLDNKVKELTIRNNELEKSNSIFSEVKEELENKILKLAGNSKELELDNKTLREDIKTKDKDIKDIQRENEALDKDIVRLKREVLELTDKINSKDSKINSLEATNNNLQDTIKAIDTLKRAEISALESKYKEEIALLNLKLDSIETIHKKDMENIKVSLKHEYEAEKKLDQAKSTLELAKLQSNYAELTGKYNEAVNKIRVKKQDKIQTK